MDIIPAVHESDMQTQVLLLLLVERVAVAFSILEQRPSR